HKKGRITVPRSSIEEDRFFELALEAGAEELTTEEEQYVITTSHDQLYAVAEALKNAGVATDGQKFTFIPDTTVPVHDEAVALQTDAPSERPRRPRRRFPRRHNRGPQEQRENFNGPGDRGDGVVAEETSGAARVNEGEQRDEGGASQNGEVEREPELGDGIIEISGKGFGFLRDAKRNFVQTPNDIFVTPEIVRRFALRDGMWIYGETRRGNRGPQLIRLNQINSEEPTKYQGLRPFEELTTINPNRKIKLETVPDRYTTRIMDLMTPLG